MASRTALPHCFAYVLAIVPIVYAADLTPQAEYEGKTVAHVRFDPPAQPLATADLTRALAFSPRRAAPSCRGPRHNQTALWHGRILQHRSRHRVRAWRREPDRPDHPPMVRRP